jgi:hypothetical protein
MMNPKDVTEEIERVIKSTNYPDVQMRKRKEYS